MYSCLRFIEPLNIGALFINSKRSGTRLKMPSMTTQETEASPTHSSFTKKPAKSPRIPTLLKLSYTAFMAILVPVYWSNYGASNFLYFCDVALMLALLALWTEKAIFSSMASVGILLPQLLWCVDFITECTGAHFTGMTSYMFNENSPLLLRGLSFFHGWLPFLLIFLTARLGYDLRGYLAWSVLAVVLCLVCYFFLPAAGAVLPDPKTPVNINYVFGFNDAKPQSFMSPGLYLTTWIVALITFAYWPTHLVLKKFARIQA